MLFFLLSFASENKIITFNLSHYEYSNNKKCTFSFGTILNPKVSISLDSCSIMHLKDLKNVLSNLIDIQIDDKK